MCGDRLFVMGITWFRVWPSLQVDQSDFYFALNFRPLFKIATYLCIWSLHFICCAVLQPHTANLTPHPAPVAPVADQSGREGWMGLDYACVAWACLLTDAGACARSMDYLATNKKGVLNSWIIFNQLLLNQKIWSNGTTSWSRTRDLLIHNQAL